MAVKFDGNSYLSNENIGEDISSDLFISFWVKYTSSTDFMRIVELAQDTEHGLQIYTKNGGAIGLDDDGGPSSSIFTSFTINDGEWHHVIAERDTQDTTVTYRLYVDGDFIDSVTGTAPIYTRIFVGIQHDGTDLFTGEVDDLRVYECDFLGQCDIGAIASSIYYGRGNDTINTRATKFRYLFLEGFPFSFDDNFGDGSIDSKWTWEDADDFPGTSYSESGGVLTIDADGNDVWQNDDEYGALYLEDVFESFEAVVKIVSQENTNQWAKAGIMVKNDISSPASSTGYCMMCVTPGNGWSFQYDSNDNGYLDTSSTVGSASYPCWVRLIKRGKDFSGYYSTTSASGPWTQVGSTQTINSANSKQDVGMFVTSHNGSSLCEVEFDDWSIRGIVNTIYNVASAQDTNLESTETPVFSESAVHYHHRAL